MHGGFARSGEAKEQRHGGQGEGDGESDEDRNEQNGDREQPGTSRLTESGITSARLRAARVDAPEEFGRARDQQQKRRARHDGLERIVDRHPRADRDCLAAHPRDVKKRDGLTHGKPIRPGKVRERMADRAGGSLSFASASMLFQSETDSFIMRSQCAPGDMARTTRPDGRPITQIGFALDFQSRYQGARTRDPLSGLKAI